MIIEHSNWLESFENFNWFSWCSMSIAHSSVSASIDEVVEIFHLSREGPEKGQLNQLPIANPKFGIQSSKASSAWYLLAPS